MYLSLRILFRGVSRFSGFLSNFWFLCRYPCFLHRYHVLPRVLRAVLRVVHGGGAVGGGGSWVVRRLLNPRTWCYPGMQFNLPAWFPILGPSLAPVPAGDWGAEIHGSSVGRTLQRRLWSIRLPIPVLVKGVLPFSLPLLRSIDKARIALPSLVFRPLKEQTAKTICWL